VSSRHLDGRLVSERRTHSTATAHSPIDANAHRTRRSSRPVSGEPYEAYLKGRFFWNKRTEADTKRGVEYFKQANALEPEYSLAYCGLADSYILMGLFALCPPHEAYPLAKVAAEQALRLDRYLPEAHAASAMVRLLYDWDRRGAERQFQRAIELNPNYSIVHQYYAYLLALLRRHEEAITHVKRARELDPLSLPIKPSWDSCT
jgi:adenylate cyclase